MKKIYMLTLAFMVLFSMTVTAEALQEKTIYRQNGVSAYAEWIETTTDNLTTDTFLSVTQSNIGIDIYMSICTMDITGNWSCNSGYKLTQENVFSMDKKLDTARLESVQIELYQWNCDDNGCWETPAGTVTIEATWTGIGSISKDSYKWMSKSGDYTAKGSSGSSTRAATVVGTINNEEPVTTDFGGLAKFKSVNMEMIK